MWQGEVTLDKPQSQVLTFQAACVRCMTPLAVAMGKPIRSFPILTVGTCNGKTLFWFQSQPMLSLTMWPWQAVALFELPCPNHTGQQWVSG